MGASPAEGSCIDTYILAVSGVCFLTTQARVLGNTQVLALLSLMVSTVVSTVGGHVATHHTTRSSDARMDAWTVICIQAVVIAAGLQLGIVFTRDNPERVAPQLVGHPGMYTHMCCHTCGLSCRMYVCGLASSPQLIKPFPNPR